MNFTIPWRTLPASERGDLSEPVLYVYLTAADGSAHREVFVVDSGADISMGPRRLCDLLGLEWEKGALVHLQGISPREECTVAATIHPVEIFVREVRYRLTIPFCFAEGDAPLLLGREGFFDVFRIQFDKQRQLTSFELF